MEGLKKLKVACIQYDPKLRDVDYNIIELNKLVDENKNKLEGSDLIVLPEMSLTGYEFDSRSDIIKFCEISCKDKSEKFSDLIKPHKSFLYASELALNFDSYVMIGFPEISPKEGSEHLIVDLKTLIEFSNFYNSAYLIDRQGKSIKVFRKHFLYQTDKVIL